MTKLGAALSALAISALIAAAPASAATVDPVAAGVPGNGRAWELVTWPGPVTSRLDGSPYIPAEYLPLAISPSGNRIVYKAMGPPPDASFGATVNQVVAERGSEGWDNRTLSYPLPQFVRLEYSVVSAEGPIAFDADLTKALWFNAIDTDGNQAFLSGPMGPPYKTIADVGANSYFRGASPDLTRVIFLSEEHLVPADAARASGTSLYEADDAGIHLLDVNDDGSLVSGCGSQFDSAMPSIEEVVFSANPNCGSFSRVYLRSGGHTVDVSASHCTLADCGPEANATYIGVSPDGSAVFISSTQRLTDANNEGKLMAYRYDIASGALNPLFEVPPGSTATSFGDAGVPIHVSADDSRAYLLVGGQLQPGLGSTSKPNLYLADSSGPHFVAAVPTEAVFVSSDGRYAVFYTAESLDPRDTDSSLDVYRYDADTNTSTLLSAGPGDSGNGPFDAKLPSTSRAIDGNRRVVFTTAEALLPQDGNEKEDVYEWTEAGLSLISGGVPGLPGAFVGSNSDGGTVFFRTSATLLPRDRDGGDLDIYAARIGGGLPEPPEAGVCSGWDCAESAVARPSRISPLGPPNLSRRLELGPIDAAARRQLARTGATMLLVEAPGPGKLTVVGRDRKHRQVAGGSARVEKAGPLRVRLRLEPAARDALARGQRVTMRLFLALGKARLRSAAFALKPKG